jgi:hypothetical protein
VRVPVKNSGDTLTGTPEETSTNKQTKPKAAAGGKLCLLWVRNHDIIMSLSQVLTRIKTHSQNAPTKNKYCSNLASSTHVCRIIN